MFLQLGADIYAGNCHKWLCSPKGSAFLYVNKEQQDWVESGIISWGWHPDNTFVTRNQMQGTREEHGNQVVEALVPLSEMFGYVGDLRSKTSGQASYSMEFDSYAECPRSVSDEIIAKTRGE